MGFEDFSHKEIEDAVANATEEAVREGEVEEMARQMPDAVQAAFEEGKAEVLGNTPVAESRPDNVIDIDEARRARDAKLAELTAKARADVNAAAEEELKKMQG